MNNFTTKTKTTTAESLPRSGHVNEVCKEWLVREDGALAYKLQSQEINDFYKGNRFRNAVVREDFPTALHEQIKESENAQRQAEAYRRRLTEQEEYDKRVAKEIADKLERDLQEQQQKELLESEIVAQKMQEIYVNLPPVIPPSSRDKLRPPPRPAKASTQQQKQQLQHQQQTQHQSNEVASSSSRHHSKETPTSLSSSTSASSTSYNQFPLQLQQQHFSNTDNYVGLSLIPNMLNMPTTPSRQQQQKLQNHHSSSSNNNHQSLLVSEVEATSPNHQHYKQRYHYHHNNHHHHHHEHQTSNTSSNSANSATSVTSSASAIRRNNVYEFQQQIALPTKPNSPRTPNSPLSNSNTPPSTTNNKHSPIQNTFPTNNSPSSSATFVSNMPETLVDELVDYSDVADSIRHYDISSSANNNNNSNITTNTNSSHSKDTSPLNTQKNINKMLSPSHENLLRTEHKFQKLSPEKYDQLVGNNGLIANANSSVTASASANAAAAERHMQQHADDIELYVDPCDYASLREIGLPMAEIKEMSKKLKQEQKDELLARRLQAMESTGNVRQEERDRMLAIEAQDKELARMLQEREKAKVKRAKEKARLRKSQQKDGNSSLCGTTNCGPLLPLPQDCMSSTSTASHHKQHSTAKSQQNQNSNNLSILNDPIDVEAYSNPIDVINSARMSNGTLTNGSLGRDSNSSGSHSRQTSSLQRHDDDIYTLPIDSCRAGQTRPVSLHVAAETVQQLQTNAMTRSEHYVGEPLEGVDVTPHMKYSKSGNFDQNASPTPPYMPIQGTRRSNSSEDRKKKFKDNKCTHQ